MIKYFTAAIALKAFSLNSSTCSAYRYLGNFFGQKRRKQESIDPYVQRGKLLVEIVNKYGLMKDGSSFVELGTGWMHWFGMYLSLYANANIKFELFDVWDNRQLDAMKAAFGKLAGLWKNDSSISNEQRNRLNTILEARSFEDLYRQTSANYRIDSYGSLTSYPEQSFDAIFSFHVLEHVRRDSIEESFGCMYRMLKPGGYCIHQIGIDDHLSHYDGKVSKKNYLKYSKGLRKRIFENVVQYHNVLQGEDFLRAFQCQGFEVTEMTRERCDIEGLPIHSDWHKYSQEDLETTIFTITCRKPG